MAMNQACQILDLSRSGYCANAAAHQQRLAAPVVCAVSVKLMRMIYKGQIPIRNLSYLVFMPKSPRSKLALLLKCWCF